MPCSPPAPTTAPQQSSDYSRRQTRDGSEKVLDVGFEASVGQRHHEGVENVRDTASEDLRFGKQPGMSIGVEHDPAIAQEAVLQIPSRERRPRR